LNDIRKILIKIGIFCENLVIIACLDRKKSKNASSKIFEANAIILVVETRETIKNTPLLF